MAQYGINEVLSEIRLTSQSETEKGSAFEEIMKRWFLSDPRYANLEKVWLWSEFPYRDNLGRRDLGIDLVAKTDMGDYWAIQCKCYAENAIIDKDVVNSFLAQSSRFFTDEETFQNKEFSNLIWVSTTRGKWSNNAEEAIQNLNKPFTRISLFDLETSTVDWDKLVHERKYGKAALLPGKQPRPHQSEAITKAHKYFIEDGNKRGKLIMACGTGKTYTALRIMEKLTPEKSLSLFFVPSIALLGQMLNAWMADKTQDLRAICVCSDPAITHKQKNKDDAEESVIDLAVPATTNTNSIIRQLNKAKRDGIRTVIMSTYQSIEAVAEAMKTANVIADFCICDEAHRTTGVKIHGYDEPNFTKVHDNNIIPAAKRLYMTATPRLYRESARVKAKEHNDILCSMDDEQLYGKEFYRLTFSKAVANGLLTDYKVLVLTVSEADIPIEVRDDIKKKYNEAAERKIKELNFDDATKLIGCINGLSKRIRGDKGITKEQDPTVMRRVVAFCQTINPTRNNPTAASTNIAKHFGTLCTTYKETLGDKKDEIVNIAAQHIDGTMGADERNKKIAWLKEETNDPNECRVLCNVRCLSEGVDVPALDAVLFLSPRKSEVEVVQSVGRVMRTFEGKKYGYIIIPVIVPMDVKPEDALNDNERFRVVWTILNALRSHDENFNAHVNQINLNRNRPPKIVVGGVPPLQGSYSIGADNDDDSAVQPDNAEVARELELRFGSLQDGIYARMVEKVGDKLYWENWAKEIGGIAQKFIQRITMLINERGSVSEQFEHFVKSLQENINTSIDNTQAIEMLAQHLITHPVFDALFRDYSFVNNNAVSESMELMLAALKGEGFEMETDALDKFYTSVENNVGNIDNLEGKQTIIKNLYEKFFKGAFPKTVEQLGIVYTPVECVDFIIRSVDDILKSEFHTALTNKQVHILDPFTGTGTFITRLLQLGVIKKEDMKRKYLSEIHCNEIVLLAYYIADVNIESVYNDVMKEQKYLPYDGICLTDTFQLAEGEHNNLFPEFFEGNTEQVKKQMATPVRVIIGNPPYSVGQKSADDNAANLAYPVLDKKIADTYASKSTAKLFKAVYDSYIRAFRWASDRIPKDEGGIVAFISNGAWIDGNAQDGMRRCLEEEFTSIYVLNLRGNQRTSGELSHREGGKIFDSGSRTPIAITFLVKNPAKARRKTKIYYHDIGDYLSREKKLEMLKTFGSALSPTLEWRTIVPNKKADWINQRDGLFDTLIPLAPDKKFSLASNSFFSSFSLGIVTSRDAFLYDFSDGKLSAKVKEMVDYYNQERDKLNAGEIDEVTINPQEIVWTDIFRSAAMKNISFAVDDSKIIDSLYRPYCQQKLCFQKEFIQRAYRQAYHFPSPDIKNLQICLSGTGNHKDFSCIITDKVVDFHLIESQCFPLYWYEEDKHRQMDLFDNEKNKYIRRDGISNWILKEVQKRYKAKNINKEHIFYYVYGLLHSPDYRLRFANDLKKSLPRIPIVDNVNDFMDFYKCGRALAALHLNYEDEEPNKDVSVSGLDNAPAGDCEEAYQYFRIPDKLRFKSKDDKSAIIYNGRIVISNIPQKAYEYVVNGKSAIEWLVERYCVSVDKRSLIKNDCNDWAREHHNPRYILDLLLSVINVSVKTVDIVSSLPRLNFD